jgi:hypothetical protein
VSASCSTAAISFHSKPRARERQSSTRSSWRNRAGIARLCSERRARIGSASFFFRRSVAGRSFFLRSLFFENRAFASAFSRAFALPLLVSSSRFETSQEARSPCGYHSRHQRAPASRDSPSSFAPCWATPSPATSAVAPRTGIGLCIFQRASRCAFAVQFSIRRVEALSHEGKRRREATGEGVARGLRRERRRPIVRGWSAFFSFF